MKKEDQGKLRKFLDGNFSAFVRELGYHSRDPEVDEKERNDLNAALDHYDATWLILCEYCDIPESEIS